jgi:hypothetical protein
VPAKGSPISRPPSIGNRISTPLPGTPINFGALVWCGNVANDAASRARGLHCVCGVGPGRESGDRVVDCVRCPVGSAPVTHLDQEHCRFRITAPAGSLALGVPQKTVGSRPRPSVGWDKSRGSRCRVQPLVAHDQGASAGSLVGGRRFPLKSVGYSPDPWLGSAASARNYPNAKSISNGTWSRIT